MADAEAGFGGPLNGFELMKAMIEAGAAGVHFEDQLASEKKCGHMGGKVLVPTNQFIRMLNAKAAYAEGRKHVDKSFVDLMAHGLKQVTDPAALRHFKLFFEAFLGFYKAERPSG